MDRAQAEAERRQTRRNVLSPSLITALDQLWDNERSVEQRRAEARERAAQQRRGFIPDIEVVSARREDVWVPADEDVFA